jgi:hypothetical protein
MSQIACLIHSLHTLTLKALKREKRKKIKIFTVPSREISFIHSLWKQKVIRCSSFPDKLQDKILKIKKEVNIESHLDMPTRTLKVHTPKTIWPWRNWEVFYFLSCIIFWIYYVLWGIFQVKNESHTRLILNAFIYAYCSRKEGSPLPMNVLIYITDTFIQG